MSPYPIQIAPSILSCDFAKLGEELKALTEAGADRLHIDVMDGHFVPNLTLGPDIVKAIRPHSSIPFDVHLMTHTPERLINCFADAGADVIIIHPEADVHIHRSLQSIRTRGKKGGIALNPSTSPSVLDYILDDVDLILVMSVNPGFGGQTFIENQLGKIEALRDKIKGRKILLAVDGGITPETAKRVIAAGASVLIAGTAIFKTTDYAQNIKDLRL